MNDLSHIPTLDKTALLGLYCILLLLLSGLPNLPGYLFTSSLSHLDNGCLEDRDHISLVSLSSTFRSETGKTRSSEHLLNNEHECVQALCLYKVVKSFFCSFFQCVLGPEDPCSSLGHLMETGSSRTLPQHLYSRRGPHQP